MTLKEFIKKEIAQVKAFEKGWIEDNKSEPKNFPMEMEQTDWEDQYYSTFETY